MWPIRGISGDFGITNRDTGFSLGYLGSTIVVVILNFTNLLQLNQIFADTESMYIQVLWLLLNEHVETRSCLLFFLMLSMPVLAEVINQEDSSLLYHSVFWITYSRSESVNDSMFDGIKWLCYR